MTYKGLYSASTTYDVGDVVISDTGVLYHLQKETEAGTDPTDTKYWGQLNQTMSEVINLLENSDVFNGGSGGGSMLLVGDFSNNLILGAFDGGVRVTVTFNDIGTAFISGKDIKLIDSASSNVYFLSTVPDPSATTMQFYNITPLFDNNGLLDGFTYRVVVLSNNLSFTNTSRDVLDGKVR